MSTQPAGATQHGTTNLIAEIESYSSAFASEYERQSGGVTRQIAIKGLKLLPPITSDSIIHDNACGPGIVSSLILKQFTSVDGKLDETPKIEADGFRQRHD